MKNIVRILTMDENFIINGIKIEIQRLRSIQRLILVSIIISVKNGFLRAIRRLIAKIRKCKRGRNVQLLTNFIKFLISLCCSND